MKEEQNTSRVRGEDTPDELMESFKGKGLGSIIVFTIIIHAVILLGTSVPFLMGKLGAGKSEEMSEDERIELAEKKARESLSEIAKEHGVSVKELSSQFAGNQKQSAPASDTPVPTPTPDPSPDEPESAIRKEINVKKDGPDVPPVTDDDEDLFK